MTIKFKKLSDKAVQPVRATNSGAGYNLTAAAVSTDVNERGQIVIVYHTNLAVEMPEGYEGVLRPVDSLASKTIRMVDAPKVISGNIDDEIVVKFVTTTDVVPAVYKEGEHIAQLVINKIEDVEFVELIDTTEQSAGEGDQSLPENEDMSTNSDQPNDPSGGEANIPEEA
jgi:dUTP pyrophosphatase